MRSRLTNILQGTVLFSGLFYIIIGLLFYFVPVAVMKMFVDNISESWVELVRDNSLVGPVYYLMRGFAALLVTTGASMIMPLFDPLKYRGMIYFSGVLFPFFASLLMSKHTYSVISQKNPGEEASHGLFSGLLMLEGHLLVLILAVIFFFIFASTAIALLLTKKYANQGKE